MMLIFTLALTLQDIGWLAGDWQVMDGKQCIEEHWTAPSSNLLVGMSRTIEDGRTVSFEFLRIEARADGPRSTSSWRHRSGRSWSLSILATPII
jgi:hypothetical protein